MNIDPTKDLIIIDGSSFLYRAYYGLRPLHTAQGIPVQAVYGFSRMIKKLIDTFVPHHMVLVWDSKGKTKRHEIFSGYKETRQAPPSDLFVQKEYILKIAEAIGLHQVAQEGIEADDLMYSIGLWWQKKGGSVVVVTSDKDMGQMLTKHATIYDSFKDIFIDEAAFQEKMGFPVSKTAFYFALLGDSSDNIPGVKGIGEKRALELVTQFDSLDDVYRNIHKVAQPGVRKALEAHKTDAFLSEKLFTLVDYPVTFTDKEVAFDGKKWTGARSLFEELSFKSLVKDMSGQGMATAIRSSHDKGYRFEAVTTVERLKEVIALIKEKKLFAYDTEGDGLNPLLAHMVGLSVCVEEAHSFYIPFGHKGDEQQLLQTEVIELLKPIFEDVSIKKIAHHAKFDQLVLYHHGIHEKGLIFDTILAAALVKDEWQRNSLKELSAHYLDEPMLTFKEVVDGKKRKDFSEVPLQEATEYAAADAHQTFKLYKPLERLLEEKNAKSLYYDIEMPVLEILCAMEARGIYCDASVLAKFGVEVDKKLHELYKTILAFVGFEHEEINLNSPRQVADLLFNTLQLASQKKSATGQYTTDHEVLVELAKEHPVPGYLIQYRELSKLKNTYIEALPTFINPETGRIHTTYSQTRVATGRLASSDPNLQNVPADGFGSTIREAFVPEKGHLFISADYSQIELRVLAHLSKDTHLIHAFTSGEDIHAKTASLLLGVDAETLTKHQRNIGKRINFSILYGLTPYGLSKDLAIPLKDAKKYIEEYFRQYPQVKEWMDGVIEKTKKLGYVETLYGRRRPVPGIHERNKHLFEEACRIAVNTVAQGTAAEIMKMGMINVAVALKKLPYDAAILLQIHDELLLTVPSQHVDAVGALVAKELQDVVSWKIPLLVNVAVGKNWKDVG